MSFNVTPMASRAFCSALVCSMLLLCFFANLSSSNSCFTTDCMNLYTPVVAAARAAASVYAFILFWSNNPNNFCIPALSISADRDTTVSDITFLFCISTHHLFNLFSLPVFRSHFEHSSLPECRANRQTCTFHPTTHVVATSRRLPEHTPNRQHSHMKHLSILAGQERNQGLSSEKTSHIELHHFIAQDQ